jgi:protein-tyrosine phosphatase
MIDIHCHLMPSVDDGAKDLEETLAMFENAYTSGVTDIILTPHYIKGTKYTINNAQKKKITNILREALRRTDMDINIYFGNEVYIDSELPELIKKGEVSTLADSRYVLVELPVHAIDNNAGNVFFQLRSEGYIPIIAHPERYEYFQKHPEKVMDYVKLGCLLQGNYMSLLGKYGKKAEKTLKILLKNNVIKFLCSDIHHSYNDYHLPEAQKRVLKIVKDEDVVNKLFIENPENVINDKIIR